MTGNVSVVNELEERLAFGYRVERPIQSGLRVVNIVNDGQEMFRKPILGYESLKALPLHVPLA